jgi:hypothetical protein
LKKLPAGQTAGRSKRFDRKLSFCRFLLEFSVTAQCQDALLSIVPLRLQTKRDPP